MNYCNLLKKAENMEHTYLFHCDSDAINFFKNIGSNIIVDEKDAIYFVEKDSCNTNTLYWASNTFKSAAKDLTCLKEKFKKGDVIDVAYAEDRYPGFFIEQAKDAFLNAGCKLAHHYLGYKTNTLDGIKVNCKDVESASLDDVKYIYSVMDKALGAEKERLDENDISEYVKGKNSNVFLIRSGEIPCAVIFLNIYGRPDHRMLFIRGLAVDKNNRGKGYSKELLSSAFKWADEKGALNSMLWVDKNNKIAISLYKKFGYFPYGDQELNFKYKI